MTYRRGVCIYNPSAGRGIGQSQLGAIRQILLAAVQDVSLAPTELPGHATELAERAAAQGCDLVVVYSGDGTVNEVVQGLAGRESPALLVLKGVPCSAGPAWRYRQRAGQRGRPSDGSTQGSSPASPARSQASSLGPGRVQRRRLKPLFPAHVRRGLGRRRYRSRVQATETQIGPRRVLAGRRAIFLAALSPGKDLRR